MMSVEDAARRLGVGVTMVRRWCRSGALKAEKIGARTWAIDAASVEALREQREQANARRD